MSRPKCAFSALGPALVLSLFKPLICIGSPEHCRLVKVFPDEHHPNRQSLRGSTWDVHCWMSGNVEWARVVDIHQSRGKILFQIHQPEGLRLLRSRGHEQEVKIFESSVVALPERLSKALRKRKISSVVFFSQKISQQCNQLHCGRKHV